jgi:hypothetical protein
MKRCCCKSCHCFDVSAMGTSSSRTKTSRGVKMAPSFLVGVWTTWFALISCENYVSLSWSPQGRSAIFPARNLKMSSGVSETSQQRISEKRPEVAKSNFLQLLSSSICVKQNFIKIQLVKNARDSSDNVVGSVPDHHDVLMG